MSASQSSAGRPVGTLIPARLRFLPRANRCNRTSTSIRRPTRRPPNHFHTPRTTPPTSPICGSIWALAGKLCLSRLQRNVDPTDDEQGLREGDRSLEVEELGRLLVTRCPVPAVGAALVLTSEAVGAGRDAGQCHELPP